MSAEFGILYGPQGPIYIVPSYLQGTPICPLLNCTPHPFDLVVGGQHYRLAKTGIVARRDVKPVAQPADNAGAFDVPVSASVFGPVTGLPAARDGVILIVSGMVIDAPDVSGRTDLRAPDTAPDAQVRDDKGRIIGIKRLRVQARQQPAPTTPAPTTPAPTTPAPTEEPTTAAAAEREALEALGVRPYGGEADKPVPYYSLEGERLAPYPVPRPAPYASKITYNVYNSFPGLKDDAIFGVVTRSEETWGLARVEGYGSVWVKWDKDKRRHVVYPVGERVALLKKSLTRGDKGWRTDRCWPAWMAESKPTAAEVAADEAAMTAYKAAMAAWAADEAAWRKAEEARLMAVHGPMLQIVNGELRWFVGGLEAEKWLLQRKFAAERAAEEAAAAEFARLRAAWEQDDATYRRWDEVSASSWSVETVSGVFTGSTLYCTADGVVLLDNEGLYRRLPTLDRIGWDKIVMIQYRASDGAPGVDMTWGDDDDEWSTPASDWRTVWASDDAAAADDDVVVDEGSMADALARAAKLKLGLR